MDIEPAIDGDIYDGAMNIDLITHNCASSCISMGCPYGTTNIEVYPDTPDFIVPLGLCIRGYAWVIPHQRDLYVW